MRFHFQSLTLILIFSFAGCVSPSEKYQYKLPLMKKPPEDFGQLKGLSGKISGDPISQMSLADKLFADYKRNGNESSLTQSIELTEKVLIQIKDHVPSLILLAKMKEERHQFDEAIALAMKVYAVDRRQKDALSILITANLAQGKISEAVSYADKLAANFPRTGVLALRGLTYLSQGRDEEGVYELEHAIALEDLGEEKDSSWARCILGRHFLKKNKLKEAEYLFNEGSRIDPDSSLCLDLLGQLHARNENHEKADAYFAKAFSVSKQLAHLRHQAELNDAIGKKQLALDQWSQVERIITSEMDQGRMDHRAELAKVLIRRHLPGDTIKASKLLLEELTVRQNPQTYYLLALSERENKNLKLAMEALSASLKTGEKRSESYKLFASILKERKNEKKASLYEEMAEANGPTKGPEFL